MVSDDFSQSTQWTNVSWAGWCSKENGNDCLLGSTVAEVAPSATLATGLVDVWVTYPDHNVIIMGS